MDILKYVLLILTILITIYIFIRECNGRHVSIFWVVAVSLTMAGYLFLAFMFNY